MQVPDNKKKIQFEPKCVARKVAIHRPFYNKRQKGSVHIFNANGGQICI
jgi:hypothetical protein